MREGLVVLCSATCASSAYRCTSTVDLIDGSHTVDAVQVDRAGNTSASGSSTFTVDTVTPSAPSITVPAAGSLTGDATPDITGTCETNATVTVREGATVLCTATCAASAFTCTSSSLIDGSHTIAATQSDRATNTSSASADVTFTVDTTPPSAPTIRAPVAGATLSDATPDITGTCETNASVTVREGATVLCTVTCAASAFTCTSSSLSDGSHTIAATQTDRASNTSPASADVTFTVDTAPPSSPTITAPAAGSSGTDTTPDITGNCETGAAVTVREGTTVLCTATCTASAFTCTSSTLSDGDHTVTATQTDAAGNVSLPSSGITFTVDTMAPNAPSITVPVADSTTVDTTPEIRGTCESLAMVTVREGTTVLCMATCASSAFACTPTALAEGDHTISASQIDRAGNPSAESADVTFTIDTTAPPAPTFTTPTDDAVLSDTTPTVGGTCETGSTVTVREGTTLLCTATCTASTWTCDVSPALPLGMHSLSAVQRDAGGLDSATATVTFFVAVCGDGALHGEACDDGNTTANDGCSATCAIEPGFACIGMPSVCSSDSDGDGIPNDAEVAAGTDPNDADSDDDGVLDGDEPMWNVDIDGDGLINALDPDSDDDGIFDGTELGVTTAPPATDVSAGNFVADADPSTHTNPLAADTDLGGVDDGAEDANHNGRIDAGETDPNDASDDVAPTDSDNDGLTDAEEMAFGTDPNDADSDDDGVLDGDEANWSVDTDGDGLINALDADSDGDGLFDGTEVGVTTAPSATDVSAGNFVADADPSTRTSMVNADTDGGSVADGTEDTNHNGRVDAGERDPNIASDDVPGSGDAGPGGDGGVRDGGVRDGSIGDGAVGDGAVRDGSAADGSSADGGVAPNGAGLAGGAFCAARPERTGGGLVGFVMGLALLLTRRRRR